MKTVSYDKKELWWTKKLSFVVMFYIYEFANINFKRKKERK